jgi:hypothetical protein
MEQHEQQHELMAVIKMADVNGGGGWKYVKRRKMGGQDRMYRNKNSNRMAKKMKTKMELKK